MLTELFQYLRNWFEKTKYFGNFSIDNHIVTFSDGSSLPLIEGQYFRIIGSLLNDGVYKYGDRNTDLHDETFEGSVWSMAVPPALISLISDINAWTVANADAINSPYQSESFGGYSYTRASGNSSSGNDSISWMSQFAARLAPWRKI